MDYKIRISRNPFAITGYNLARALPAFVDFIGVKNGFTTFLRRISHRLYNLTCNVTGAQDKSPPKHLELAFGIKGISHDYKLPEGRTTENLDVLYYEGKKLPHTESDILYAEDIFSSFTRNSREIPSWVSETLEWRDKVYAAADKQYLELERLNPELSTLEFDRNDHRQRGHVIGGIEARLNINDIRFYVIGHRELPITDITDKLGHLGWMPSPETLASIVKQTNIKIAGLEPFPDSGKEKKKEADAPRKQKTFEKAEEPKTHFRDKVRTNPNALPAPGGGRGMGTSGRRRPPKLPDSN